MVENIMELSMVYLKNGNPIVKHNINPLMSLEQKVPALDDDSNKLNFYYISEIIQKDIDGESGTTMITQEGELELLPWILIITTFYF